MIAEGTADQPKEQAGGAILEARVADPRDIERAIAVLASVGRGNCGPIPGAGLVSTPAGEGTGLLLDAGHRLQEAGIALDDLGIRQPTLDEVFLSLTGGGSADYAESPKAEARQ